LLYRYLLTSVVRSLRGYRDDVMKKIKTGETDEDIMFRMKEQAQKAVDGANALIEDLLENKIKEIND